MDYRIWWYEEKTLETQFTAQVQPNIPTLYLSLYPYYPSSYLDILLADHLSLSFRKYAQDQKDAIILADLDNYIRNNQEEFNTQSYYDPDSVHFTSNGYDKLGEIIFQSIEQHLDQIRWEY